MAWHGEAATAYTQTVFQQRLGWEEPMAWMYPPPAFLILAPLSQLPYSVAYIVFTAASVFVYGAAAYRIVRHPLAPVLAIVFAGMAVNLMYGQNAALLAAALAFGLMKAERHPYTGGLILGLLLLKPHYVPLVVGGMLAAKQWRVVAGMATTGVALLLASVLCFGVEPWRAFIAQLHEATTLQTTMPPVDAIAPLAVGGVWLQWFCLIACVSVGASAKRSFTTRATVLTIGICLAAPYLHFYDLAVLGLPVALYARKRMENALPVYVLASIGLWLLRFGGAVYGVQLTPYALLIAMTLVMATEA